MPDRGFVDYCLSVVNTIGMAEVSGSSSSPTGPITEPEPYVIQQTFNIKSAKK
jgi:hypothetical protein